MSENVLVIGACGQLGTELVEELRKLYNETITTEKKFGGKHKKYLVKRQPHIFFLYISP